MSMPFTPLAYQKEALEEITARANAYFAGQWKNLPIHPRWHTLICGPTGVGKTALAVLAAERVGASLLRISAPGWMPAGAHQRGTMESITVVAEHVARHERTMLVLDEMDKLVDGGSSSAGNDSWRSYIRGEIYDLADGRWPAGMRQPDDEECNEVSLDILTTKLKESVFILGVGTFQDWYDHSSSRRSMGFGAELDSEPPPDHGGCRRSTHPARTGESLQQRFNQVARPTAGGLPPDCT
jgi:SpoVK/Ycf46/Vps4 family AAA+-type ATPase